MQQIQQIPQVQQVQQFQQGQQIQQVQVQQIPLQQQVQQQVFTIPSQTYRVVSNIEPKSLVTNYPPPQEFYRPQQQQFQTEQMKVNTQQLNFTKVANPPPIESGYRDVFSKFASSQP